jgi:hypothetical protein
MQHGLISEKVFVAIILGALVSLVIVGPLLTYSINKRKKISVLEFFVRDAIVPAMKETERDTAIEKLSEIASRLDARLENGSPDIEITGVAGIEEAGEGQITFVANPKYAAAARSTRGRVSRRAAVR